jgi:hypothetical protein
MEDPTSESVIDEVLNALAKVIGKPVICPCCGNADWLRATSQLSRNLANVYASTGERGQDDVGIPLTFICTRCGFMRNHAVTPSSFR